MRVPKLNSRFLVITFCLAIVSLTFSLQITKSQVKPLSLAEVLTGLQSKSGDFTLAQKNAYILENVQKRGITFRLTADLEKELLSAGASTALIRAIRLKSSQTRPTPRPSVLPEDEKPNATYEKIWVEQNVVDKDVNGIRIFANFNVYNMKEVESDIVYRFKKNDVFLEGATEDYKTTTGLLSARRLLKPNFSATVYEDLDAFVPYSEFNLAPGVHNLKMESAVITRDGAVITQFTTQDLRLVIPRSTPTIKQDGTATLGKIWVDYKVQENGVWGMKVHVSMTVRNMKDQAAYMRVLFTKDDDTILRGLTSNYRTNSGQTAVFTRIQPSTVSAYYNDIEAFIPYTEFNLPVGKYTLKLHADATYLDGTKMTHLAYQSFTYTRSK